MLAFEYTARDQVSGQKVKGKIEANDLQAATKLVKEQGYVPIDVNQASEGGLFSKFGKRIKSKDKILFSRQLSTLINAGLPLVQSLRTVANQTQSKPLKTVANTIITDVESGSALSLALQKHPKVFNQIFVSMVAAGETSGTLDKALERLALQQEKDAEIVSKVKGAMIYPIIVLSVMFVVMGFMIVKVLPQVEVLYDGMPGAKLPLITTILLAIAHALTKYWWIFFVVVGLFVFLGTRWVRTLAGRRFADRIKMKAGPIGHLFMKLYMARFARTSETLIASGVPLLQVLDITANSINNVHIEESIRIAANKVKGGKSLADVLSGDPNFLSLVPDMLKIGETSGAMEAMLDKTADYFEKEVDDEVKAISTIIEPVLMVILGVFAFIIVAAVLLPVYGLAGQSVI